MARVSKGKRQYLVQVYRGLMQLGKLREVFCQPVLTHVQLRALNVKRMAFRRRLTENANKLMAEMGIPESYLVMDTPVRRQRVIEIDKSTGQPRQGLPMVTLFTEKGPTDV